MNKTPTTWRAIVKKTAGEVPKGSGLKAILPRAKKVWALIKSGNHPTMMVATGSAPKGKSSKRRKSSKRHKSSKRRKSRKRKKN